jgi:hypothetical protein
MLTFGVTNTDLKGQFKTFVGLPTKVQVAIVPNASLLKKAQKYLKVAFLTESAIKCRRLGIQIIDARYMGGGNFEPIPIPKVILPKKPERIDIIQENLNELPESIAVQLSFDLKKCSDNRKVVDWLLGRRKRTPKNFDMYTDLRSAIIEVMNSIATSEQSGTKYSVDPYAINYILDKR